jgi:uncharacterized membrane protein
MSKKGVFGKLLTADKSDVCEYFTPSGVGWNSQPITAAVFAKQPVVMSQMKKQLKIQAANGNHSNTFINMIFVIGNVNGSLKIYHNESNYLTHSTDGSSGSGIGGGVGGTGGGHVFDDDDDESPVRK